MSMKNRYLLMALAVAVAGALLALIGLGGFDQLEDFAGGFGVMMILLGVIEIVRSLRLTTPGERSDAS